VNIADIDHLETEMSYIACKYSVILLTRIRFAYLDVYVAPATYLEIRMGSALSASTLVDMKDTRKRQSCHKLAIGNWNFTSLTGKEYALAEEAKLYFFDVVVISSTKRRGSNTAHLVGGWMLLCTRRWVNTFYLGWGVHTGYPSAGKLCW